MHELLTLLLNFYEKSPQKVIVCDRMYVFPQKVPVATDMWP